MNKKKEVGCPTSFCICIRKLVVFTFNASNAVAHTCIGGVVQQSGAGEGDGAAFAFLFNGSPFTGPEEGFA